MMKIKVEYTNDMIKDLIIKDIQSRVNIHSSEIKRESFEIKVRSKQNYRNDEWERGELKVEMEVDV